MNMFYVLESWIKVFLVSFSDMTLGNHEGSGLTRYM